MRLRTCSNYALFSCAFTDVFLGTNGASHTSDLMMIIANDFTSNSEKSPLDQLGTVKKMDTELIITYSGEVADTALKTQPERKKNESLVRRRQTHTRMRLTNRRTRRTTISFDSLDSVVQSYLFYINYKYAFSVHLSHSLSSCDARERNVQIAVFGRHNATVARLKIKSMHHDRQRILLFSVHAPFVLVPFCAMFRRRYSLLRSVSLAIAAKKTWLILSAPSWLLMQNTNGFYRSYKLLVFIYRWLNFSRQNSWLFDRFAAYGCNGW